MSTFFRYLLSLAMHVAWRRAGKGGAIPPMRLPGKGKAPVNLPVIGPWQMMAAMWVVKRVWGRYGTQIKDQLTNHSNDLTRRVAQYIPDPKLAGATSNATSSTRSAPTISPAPISPAPMKTPPAAPNHNTRPLSNNASTPNAGSDTSSNAAAPSAPTTLPHGSILGKLRGRS